MAGLFGAYKGTSNAVDQSNVWKHQSQPQNLRRPLGNLPLPPGRLQGGQWSGGMRCPSDWPSHLPADSGLLPSWPGLKGQPALRQARWGASGDTPVGSTWSQKTILPSRKFSCQDGFLSCLPKIPITANCLLCVALAIIFVPLWCLLCHIFKGSYHVSFAKLYTLRVFSSLHINLSLPAPQHLPIRAVQCLLWIACWKWRNFSP